VAVTDRAALMVTVHVAPDTESHPLHPLRNMAGLAVSVTTVSMVYGSEQSVPQLIPCGLELTVPVSRPRPALLTVSTKRFSSKMAVTVLAAFIVTVHVVPETVSHPPQPAKVELLAALAVRVTVVPLL
jgi:hypothetical protein